MRNTAVLVCSYLSVQVVWFVAPDRRVVSLLASVLYQSAGLATPHDKVFYCAAGLSCKQSC
jgi:hypothetical protein